MAGSVAQRGAQAKSGARPIYPRRPMVPRKAGRRYSPSAAQVSGPTSGGAGVAGAAVSTHKLGGRSGDVRGAMAGPFGCVFIQRPF